MHAVRCCRLSGLLVRLSEAAGPYGDTRIGSNRLRELEGSADLAGLPDPVSLTVWPYSLSVLPTSPTAPAFQAAAGTR